MPDIFNQPHKSKYMSSSPAMQNNDSHNNYLPKTFSQKYPGPTSVGLFSSFCMHPTGLTFRNQEEDENIILFLRRHFIINVPWIAAAFFFLFIPLIAITLIKASGLELFAIPQTMVFAMLAFYYLVIFTYALINFIVWFYHVGIVTQKRLLDLDILNILSHHLAETEIADVVDVSHKQQGFFQSFFDYGDVHIQTTAVRANFEFETSPKPAVVSDIITDLRPKKD